MKFEDKIKEVGEKLDENFPVPQATGTPAPIAGQQPQAGQQQQQQQQPLTADQMLDWVTQLDPNDPQAKEFGKLQGEAKFKAIADAMANSNTQQNGQPNAQQNGQPNAQMNPIASAANNQTGATNTSGTMGTQV